MSNPPAAGRPGVPAVPATADKPLLPVVGHDTEVPLVTGGNRRYANLDYAASAPCLAEVAAHVTEILPFSSGVHRGAGYFSQVSTALYESARTRVAAFAGAREDDAVVFTRNTTDALNLLARCVPDGGPDVLVLDLEHHANFLPWQSGPHRCLPAAPTWAGTLVCLRAELSARPPALLAITGASNVTGEMVPVPEVVAAAHDVGARVVLDAAQLAPHRRIDVAGLDVDFVAFSGHKMYAPFGAGALIGRRDWLDAAPPYLAGGGAVREVRAGWTEWDIAPGRHEGGTPNLVGAAALAEAGRILNGLPAGALEAHEAALRRHLVDGLSTLDGVRLPKIWRDSGESIGVVAFTVDGFEPGLVAAYLSAEQGVGLRDGRFCAHPLLRRLGLPGGALRASFGAGSCRDDVERLVTGIGDLLRKGPGRTYGITGGRWCPEPDPRPWPGWLRPPADASTGNSPCAIAAAR